MVFDGLLVEIDSLCVTQLVQKPLVAANEYSPLICSIKELFKPDWHVTINHVYRKANFAANFLANYALSLPL